MTQKVAFFKIQTMQLGNRKVFDASTILIYVGERQREREREKRPFVRLPRKS